MRMTDKQSRYLLRLINDATGKEYRYLSHVKEDDIGKRLNKVRGFTSAEASALISKWLKRAKAKHPRRYAS